MNMKFSAMDFLVESILNQADTIVDDLEPEYSKFYVHFQCMEHQCLELTEESINQDDVFDLTQTLITEELNSYQTFTEELKKAKKELSTTEGDLMKLHAEEMEKQAEVAKLEKVYSKMMSESFKINKKREHLKQKEDEILAYKLLTGAEFVYNTSKKVQGYIIKDDGLKPFNFNSTMDNEEITAKLWSLITE